MKNIFSVNFIRGFVRGRKCLNFPKVSQGKNGKTSFLNEDQKVDLVIYLFSGHHFSGRNPFP